MVFFSMKPYLMFFYLIFALFLALLGAWLLVDPNSLLGQLHLSRNAMTGSVLLSQQTGLGMLLAAGVNLFCMARADARSPLHALVLLYLAGLALTHGAPMTGHGLWIWLPVALYALPLFALLPVKMPKIGRSSPALNPGEEVGEVKWFNPTKGFGFLLGSDGREVFVHFRAVQNGGRRSLRQGQTVRFTTRDSERGEQADEVYIEREGEE
jgi:cold shock CspA family protein|tara:strand:- start:61331 stop:61960 length:630 start_codon:yes stop_codon:yes gene_type:complete